MGYDIITDEQKARILELAIKAIDGDMLPAESAELERTVSNSKVCADYYSACIKTHLSMIEYEAINTASQRGNQTALDQELWQKMAFYEKTAPGIEIPTEEQAPELVQKIVYPPREKRKVSKLSIVFLAMNAAAILFVILFLKFAPSKVGIEIATLTDSINAKWADVNISMQSGTRLHNDSPPLMLREGLVELKFDNNARITIEGPAEFQLLDNDMIKLNYGQLYSEVPPEAYGFQICTQYAKIIDLGTEFGVKEEVDGDTEVHVLKGQVNFVSGVLNKKINVDLLAGSARQLNVEKGQLEEIPCKDHFFARQIESKKNVIWRGEQSLDLADIVGGGNGLGTGILGSGIDATSGVYTTTPTRVEFNKAQGQYNPVPGNLFIDGVFVPDGADEMVVLNSLGQYYSEFPVTEGIYRSPITHGPAIRDRQRFPSRAFKESMEFYLMDLEMDGVLYGTSNNPAIYMHTNVGITFDLDAIRSAYGNHAITHFVSTCGIPEMVLQKYASKTNNSENSILALYVFQDDQCRLVKTFNNTSKPEKIRIPIRQDSRFLTFAVVDTGQYPDYDWCLLGKPVLEFE